CSYLPPWNVRCEIIASFSVCLEFIANASSFPRPIRMTTPFGSRTTLLRIVERRVRIGGQRNLVTSSLEQTDFVLFRRTSHVHGNLETSLPHSKTVLTPGGCGKFTSLRLWPGLAEPAGDGQA